MGIDGVPTYDRSWPGPWLGALVFRQGGGGIFSSARRWEYDHDIPWSNPSWENGGLMGFHGGLMGYTMVYSSTSWEISIAMSVS